MAPQEWGLREWTRQVIHALIELGTERGYMPYPTPCLRRGEWLYDVIWLRENENERVMSVPLVAKIEWWHRNSLGWSPSYQVSSPLLSSVPGPP